MNKLTERLQVKTCAQCPNHCESGDGKKDCEASDYPWLAVRVEFMSLISCLSFSSFCWNNHQTVGFNFATFFTVAGSVCFKPTREERTNMVYGVITLLIATSDPDFPTQFTPRSDDRHHQHNEICFDIPLQILNVSNLFRASSRQ